MGADVLTPVACNPFSFALLVGLSRSVLIVWSAMKNVSGNVPLLLLNLLLRLIGQMV